MLSGVNYWVYEPVLSQTANPQTVSHCSVVGIVGDTSEHSISSQSKIWGNSYRWILWPNLILVLTHTRLWLHTEEVSSPGCFLYLQIYACEHPLSQPLCVSDQRQTKHIKNNHAKPSFVLFLIQLQRQPAQNLNLFLSFPCHCITSDIERRCLSHVGGGGF